ncbi:unnamed protein product [Pleuronectes platessa]|uniref:Uncharacterized protein n=1 Tax=Pleuronectes platessa TaxID=8262 RepID=A0A9N7VSS6_PLEPL|nr:unnamed protein product [Pleuronectes platessa]
MLVGVDIWSDKDQIEVSTDSKVTLDRFLEWRLKSLLPRIPHDNAQFITYMYPKLFSICSQQQLSQIFEKVDQACLLNTPSTNRIHGGPVCGNAFLEPGEECDCGTMEECKNTCCIASTCKLAQCTEGECCHNCRLKPSGSVCRPKAGDCDLADYCTGFSAFCPTDAYTQNGLSCNRGKGYCYNGQCPSQQDHCKRLRGPDNFPADLGIVPTGTKCGNNMVCYNQRCQNITNVLAFGANNCSAKCNNHGVCNHENECHCDPGWAPPLCDVLFPVLPEETGMLGFSVLLVVGALLLVVLVIWISMYCIRKRRSAKRCLQSTPGWSNPVLRSSSTQDSSCHGNTLISQP